MQVARHSVVGQSPASVASGRVARADFLPDVAGHAA